jgi:hypothetical protein
MYIELKKKLRHSGLVKLCVLIVCDTGYCSTLKLAGVPCPKIQDPAFTYGNPGAAREQSERQIENTERAIQGFEQAVPDNLGRGFVIK